ncbi:T9SS type A sorting domain-containing protein [Wocania ichthyoenteri]|uniref:T9SS type A sorting domain-containing protein n=1 Tax=Wocania ichthyoenteri TaxID=1230531 RepID=UPI00053E1791|nr:T9SS type A sorting domain-containing protein [Wocania ichthyoenteri]
MKKITLKIILLTAISMMGINSYAQTIVYYEDFRYATTARGFTQDIVSDGGHTAAGNILNRAGDVPDLADSNNLFDPSVDRPANRIPNGNANEQRCITTRGDNGTTNFAVDAYAVFTTLDLTSANALIEVTDTYKYATFWTERRYGDGDIATITMMVSIDYAGDVSTATWNALPLHSGKFGDSSDGRKYVKGVVDLTSYANGANGSTVTLAMRYQGSASAYSGSNRNGTFYISDLQFIAQPTVLGTKDNVLEEGIATYPNPASQFLNIKKLDNSINIKNTSLYNVIGKEVYRSNNTNPIDVSNFSKGLYFLKLGSLKGGVLTKKVIVE